MIEASIQRLLISLFLLFLFPASVVAQSEEDPAEVVGRFVEALGGEMALNGVETLYAKAHYLGGGTDSNAKYFFKDGQLLRIMNNGSDDHLTRFDGQTWSIRNKNKGFQGLELLASEKTIRITESRFDLPTDALRLMELADQMELMPKEGYADTDWADCICLKLKDDDPVDIRRFFDPNTDLLVCVERWNKVEEGHKFSIRYYDFKYVEVDGIMFKKNSSRTRGAAWTCHITYSDFKIDGEVDSKLFDIEGDDD